MYDAHINVEWCNQSREIKYLFKYIRKGPDRATIEFIETGDKEGHDEAVGQNRTDEIKQYLMCRFISACEAIWRIYGFDIHYSWVAVIRLLFHLEGKNTVTITDTESLTNTIDHAANKKTMFTEWLNLNKGDQSARKYTYAEVANNYVWHAKERRWGARVCQKPIGRIVYCHPAGGEKYYLRMLLNVVRGAESFEEIRTVNRVIYNTYRQACYARGMLNDDAEWTDAIKEAKVWATGKQLRELFVTILLFCDVSTPRKLWDENWEVLSEDILYQKRRQFRFPGLHLSEKQQKTYCLIHIENILAKHGKKLEDYPDLPTPDKSIINEMENRLIREELSYNTREMETIHAKLVVNLNEQQKLIYDKIIGAVMEKKDGMYFVYGAGGTGKTYLYRTIMARMRSEGKIVLAVASSGIGALLLTGGRTTHSRFMIPLELMEDSTCGISQNSDLAKLMHKVELIIWDEAPMTHRFAFEALNRTLQDIMGIKHIKNRNRLFGGITVLLGGDFCQILLVITKGRRQEIVDAAINNSPLWDQCEVLILTRSMRVKETNANGEIDAARQEFNEWIRQIGEGKAKAKQLENEDEVNLD